MSDLDKRIIGLDSVEPEEITDDLLIPVFVPDGEGDGVTKRIDVGDLPAGDYNDLTNKPTLGTAASHAATDFATSAQGAAADSAVQPGDLATVATSGDYDDLTDKPAIPDSLTDLDTTVTGAQLNSMKTKVDGIESGADVTDATNVDAAGAVMNSDTSTAAMGFVVDEDNMVSNSATKVPTQQSVKAYVDAHGGGGGGGDMLESTYDPQGIADDAFDRANHTGTQTASTISDFNTAADARISSAVGSTVQGYDDDLAALAGVSSVGVLRRTGAGTATTMIAPSGSLVGTSDTQTLTNKTLTSPVINSPTGITKSDVGLGNVTNDAQLKAANLDTDTTLSANSDTKIPSQKAIKAYVDKPLNNETIGQGTTLHSFGDSITYGTGATDRLVNAWPVVLAGYKGWTLTNHGVSGARINDGTVLDAIMSQIVGASSNYTLMIGTNNARIRGMDLGYLDTYRGCLMNEVVWLALPDTAKLYASAMTTGGSGSWVSNSSTVVGAGHGMKNTSSGGTLTGTVFGTTVYIGTYATQAGTTNFTVTIDGVSYAGFTGSEHTSLETRQDDSGTFSAYMLRFPGLAHGAHTVVITTGSGGAYIDWIAGNGYHKEIDGPSVWLSNIIRATDLYYTNHSTYSDAVVALYNGAIAEVASSLALDGLDVCFVDSLSALNNSTDMLDDDDLHPNDTGYVKIAQAFYANMSAFVKPRDRGASMMSRTPWIKPTLGSGFTNIGSPYSDVQFYKDPAGIVHIRGSMTTSGISAGSIIFTLPVGYRPARYLNFPTVGNDGFAMTRVRSDGQVQYRAGTVSTYYSIDGIAFKAEQ